MKIQLEVCSIIFFGSNKNKKKGKEHMNHTGNGALQFFRFVRLTWNELEILMESHGICTQNVNKIRIQIV